MKFLYKACQQTTLDSKIVSAKQFRGGDRQEQIKSNASIDFVALREQK